jgi:poly-gamma-glutamate capsule biosynthesis protein CapA/YwtB (metallophosphatase superfamily)
VVVAAVTGDEDPSSPRARATTRGAPASPTTAPPTTAQPTTAQPSESPTGSPTPTTEPRGALLIHGTGDVVVDPDYIPNLRSFGYDYAWSGVDGLFERDELTVINLECTVSYLGDPLPKTFIFRCDPEALDEMLAAGVEVANLGNNHAYDHGPEALVDSVRNLRQAGIEPVGAGQDAAEALAPALFEISGWKIAVVGIDEVVDPFPEAVATEDKPGTAAGHDREAMVRAIRAAERAADLVIVTIHWGVELDLEPRDYQVEEARRFIDAGADIIFGHHAHRLQPLDVIDGKPVFWGLGNFVFPRFSLAGGTSAVAEVRVKPNGTMDARLLPAFIEDHGHPVLQGD